MKSTIVISYFYNDMIIFRFQGSAVMQQIHLHHITFDSVEEEEKK